MFQKKSHPVKKIMPNPQKIKRKKKRQCKCPRKKRKKKVATGNVIALKKKKKRVKKRGNVIGNVNAQKKVKCNLKTSSPLNFFSIFWRKHFGGSRKKYLNSTIYFPSPLPNQTHSKKVFFPIFSSKFYIHLISPLNKHTLIVWRLFQR